MANLLLALAPLLLLSALLAEGSLSSKESVPGGHAAASGTAPSNTRPNIIWLQSDSMDGRLHDPTDEEMYSKLKLTSYRSWTSSGVVFARHYCNSPQCVPSRTSMMTGRYIHSIDSPNNGQGIAFSTLTGEVDKNCVAQWNSEWCASLAAEQRERGVNRTIIDYMRDLGYDLALFGRFDTGAGILQDYEHTTGDGWHDGPSLDILARGAAIWGSVDPDPLSSTTETDKSPYESDVHHQRLALGWLSNRTPSTKPFFLWLGMLCPHPPYATNSSWISHVNTSAPDAPAQIPKNSTHYYDAYMSMSKGVWDESYTDDQVKLMRQAYWGAASEASVLMEEVLQLASRTGALNNTVIIITSDHGEMSLEHWQDLKNSMREPSVRVPLAIIPMNVPGMAGAAGRVVTNITSHLDILPTLVDLAGGQPRPEWPGSSLVPFLRTAPSSSRKKPLLATTSRKNYAVIEYHSNFAPTGSYAVVQYPWKLVVYGHNFPYLNATNLPPQLFNTVADPREMNDVAAANPSQVAVLQALMEAELGASVSTIEAAMMSSNLDNYNLVWFNTCTGEELVAKLLKVFSSASRVEVIARITAWSGNSPLNAKGPGGKCGLIK